MRFAALLLAAIVMAGCSSSDSGGSDDGNVTDGGDDDGNFTVPAAQTHAVSMSNNAFAPRDLTINMGDTVEWTHNDGTVPHNVESSDPSFDSNPQCTGPQAQLPVSDCMRDGDTYTYTFEEVGDVSYECEIHSGMTGTITVVDPTVGNGTT